MASAPKAQRPYSSIRDLKKPVATYQLTDRWPSTAETATAMPTRSVTAPTQSHAVQVFRHRRDRSLRHARASSTSASTGRRIASWVRTPTATTQAATASTIETRLGRIPARAIR